MLPADMPPPRTMQSLGWLIDGAAVADHEDGLYCTLPAGVWFVTNAELEELAARGWVDLSVDEHVTVTERGVYWARRWHKENPK